MFSLETLIMVSAIVLCVGGLLGAVISRKFLPPQNQKDLEQRLQETREELQHYQQDVAQHFADTSRLVNNLTQSYREVHEHLARGAVQLTNSEISRQILEAGDGKLGLEASEAVESASFEPPRDWAPKSPGQAGTLSEEFGLTEEEDPNTDIPGSLQEDQHKQAS